MERELKKTLEEQARRNSGVGVDVVKKWQKMGRQPKLSILIIGREVYCEGYGTAVIRWQGIYQDGVEAVPWATVSLRGRGKSIHGSLSPAGELILQEQIEEAEKIRLTILKGLVS